MKTALEVFKEVRKKLEPDVGIGEYKLPHIIHAMHEYSDQTKQPIIKIIDDMIEEKTELKELASKPPMNDIDIILIGKYEYCADELTELKQKITGE